MDDKCLFRRLLEKTLERIRQKMIGRGSTGNSEDKETRLIEHLKYQDRFIK